MALAKRSSRTITVDDAAYCWALSPDSGYMWLVVERADGPGQRLEAYFDYHDASVPAGTVGGGQRRSVSPSTVRAVVLHALANGWQPEGRGIKPLRIDGEAICPVE